MIRHVLVLFAALYLGGLSLHLALRVLFGDRFGPLAFVNTFTALYFFPVAVIVPLLVGLRARRMSVLSAFLGGIGVLWIAPMYVPKPPITPEGPTLRVLTFNGLRSNHDIAEDTAWIRAQKPDVIFLQEMTIYYGPEWVARLKPDYPYAVEQRNPGADMGTVTLSRFPLRKGAHNSILVDFGGQTIALYNVHMPVPVRENWARGWLFSQLLRGYSIRPRDDLIHQLLIVLGYEARPFIVAGDFNMSDQSVIYGELAARMHDSFRERAYGFGWSWPIARHANLPWFIPPLVRIDYIWHSDHFRTIEAAQGPALHSDHLPLTAVLELVPESKP